MLHSEKPQKYVESDDDDDEDCLVANETLQISEVKKRRLTSPPVQIRKIAKRRDSCAIMAS